MRYTIIFSTVIAFFGVILVSGALFMVPYSVRQQVRVDKSKTWVEDTFSLTPFKNRTYYLDSVLENTSIIQVDIESSDFIVLKIIIDNTGKLWYERKATGIRSSFWTPPTEAYEIWRFVFQNPTSTSVNVTAEVTEFYNKVSEYQEVTYYRSLFDPVYGYNGIIALIVAIGLNVIHISREAKNKTKTNLQMRTALLYCSLYK